MDKIADRAGTPKSEDSGMIIRVIIFEVTILNTDLKDLTTIPLHQERRRHSNKKAELPRDAPNIRVPSKLSRVLTCKRLLFRNLEWAFVPIDTKNVRTKLEVRGFTRSVLR